MKTHVILSVSGKEEGGFMNKLTLKTRELGGKWLANKMTHLDGYLSGLLKMEIEADKLESFKTMMAEFSGITVSYYDADNGIGERTKPVKFTIEGEDRSGLTSDITHLLDNQDVKVELFESQRFPVTVLGAGVFEAHLDVQLPESLTAEALKEGLEGLGDKIRVSIVEA